MLARKETIDGRRVDRWWWMGVKVGVAVLASVAAGIAIGLALA